VTRGAPWCDNDTVNAIATAAGATAAIVFQFAASIRLPMRSRRTSH
jgi:uncharacterized membrane protein